MHDATLKCGHLLGISLNKRYKQLNMNKILKNTPFQIIAGIIFIIAITWGSIILLSRHNASYSRRLFRE